MANFNVTDAVVYVGVQDRDIDLFESQYDVPNGMAYNSYIIFDEKIAGSIHFTPGECYDDAWNGNVSSIHWDLVLDQTIAHGGGEIYFDDVLIRKDGIFVLDELKCLNPENLTD